MVISFSHLPHLLQLECLYKIEYKDYTRLKRSSRLALILTEKVKNRLPLMLSDWNITMVDQPYHCKIFHSKKRPSKPDVQIDFVIKDVFIQIELTQQICTQIINTLVTQKIRVEKIAVSIIQCHPGLVNKLAQVSKVLRLAASFHDPWNPEFLQQTAVQNCPSLACASPIDNSDFLKLKSGELYCHFPKVTSAAINMALKEWLAGEREIVYWTIFVDSPGAFDESVFKGLSCRKIEEEEAFETCNSNQQGFGISRKNLELFVIIEPKCAQLALSTTSPF